MHELEARTQPILVGMLEGRGRLIHRGGQETLAAWSLKTSMMFDQASPAEDRPIPPADYRQLLANGRPPPGTQIWIASYDASSPGMTAVAALEAAGPDEPDPGGRNVYVRTFTAGRIAIQVFGTTSPMLRKMKVDWPFANVHQLWPPGDSFTWTATPALDDQGLAAFRDMIVIDLLRRSASVVL